LSTIAARREDIEYLHGQGLSTRKISERLGVSPQTVGRWLRRRGLAEKQIPRMMSPEDKMRAEMLLDDGASVMETARTLGFNATTVARHFPGRAWNKSQVGKYGADVRRLRF
jgi:IS30 family transposase